MGESEKVNRELISGILDKAVPEAMALVAASVPALGLLMVVDEDARTFVQAGATMGVAATFKLLIEGGYLNKDDFTVKED